MEITLGKNVNVKVLSSGITPRDMVKRQKATNLEEDAFFMVNLGTVLKKHEQWKDNLARVKPFYAVKCNDDSALLQTMVGLGLGFDCASKAEIEKMLKLGASPSRIVFANPCKTIAHLKYAASKGVDLMTFDNMMELDKVKKYYPQARLLLRIRADDPEAICQLGIKFGADPAHAPLLLGRAKELDLNIVGISFHVGSGCQNASAFGDAVVAAHGAFEVGTALGYEMKILDIGGGFPGTDTAQISFEEIASVLNTSLDMYFPSSSGVQIIAEPGRYYASSCHTLAVSVTSKRAVESKTTNESSFMYYVSDGVYGSFNCLLYDHAVVDAQVLDVADGAGSSRVHKSSVWGPTCDSLDCILESCKLPELDIGDWMFFEDMGAYTKAAASSFNGFAPPTTYYVVTDDMRSALEECLPPMVSTKGSSGLFIDLPAFFLPTIELSYGV